jgi:glycosyltransferase involved in cell wall biosynthesis
VKNEEGNLARCLESAKGLADEIIVVDTGSDDRTKEIASRYTDKVYDFEWICDFSAARNFSFSKATMDFIMWLDADDVIEPGEAEKIRELKLTIDERADVAMLKYNVAFGADGAPTTTFYRERILRRSKNFVWLDPVHETVTPEGRVIFYDIAVSHRKQKPNEPGRNLRVYERMENSGAVLTPRQTYYYGRELYYEKQYEKAISKLSPFIEAGEGWRQNLAESCQILSYCYAESGDEKASLDALFKSLRFGPPRAEICCDIGTDFIELGDFKTAAFWFETAKNTVPDMENGGFTDLDCYGYIPNIWLCVCYDRLGDRAKAIAHNEAAAAFKPDDPSVVYNRVYFNSN